MKIIKHGNINRPLKGECNICGCEIECDKEEVPAEDIIGLRMVKCPDCENGIIHVR